jgi:hypothetical protein
LVALAAVLGACQEDVADLAGAGRATSTIDAVTSTPPTSTPPPSTLTGQGVEPCQAGDETIVSAHVADLGGHLVATADGLWMSRFGSPEVVHVDAATLCPDATVTVEGADLGVAAMALGDDGLVYVAAAQSGAVSVIDQERATASLLAPEASGGGGLAVADGRLWAVCCGVGGAATRPSGVFDLASGDLLAELDIGPGMDVEVVGDTAWIGRTDATGLYQVSLGDGEAEIAETNGVGTTTVAVSASEDGVYLVGDEPVLQQWVDGEIQEVSALPFPRERPVDIDLSEDGSVFAVSAFGPGLFWIRSDGNAFNLGGAQSLIQVEAVGDWVWTLDTGGVLTRIARSGLGG